MCGFWRGLLCVNSYNTGLLKWCKINFIFIATTFIFKWWIKSWSLHVILTACLRLHSLTYTQSTWQEVYYQNPCEIFHSHIHYTFFCNKGWRFTQVRQIKGNREHIWCLIAFRVDMEELKENRKVQVPVMAGKRRERWSCYSTAYIIHQRQGDVCEQRNASSGYMTKSTAAVVFIRSWLQTP